MSKYRIDFYSGDIWHTDLLKRFYLEFESEDAARAWAESQNIGYPEIMKVK